MYQKQFLIFYLGAVQCREPCIFRIATTCMYLTIFYWNLLCPPCVYVPLALFSSPWTFSHFVLIRDSWTELKVLFRQMRRRYTFWSLAENLLGIYNIPCTRPFPLEYYSRFSYILIRYTFYLNSIDFSVVFFSSIPNNRRNSLRQLSFMYFGRFRF